MPDPITDLKNGIPEAELKKRYKLNDDDLTTLKKFNAVTTGDDPLSPDDALQLYPGASKFITAPAPKPAAAPISTKQNAPSKPATAPEPVMSDEEATTRMGAVMNSFNRGQVVKGFEKATGIPSSVSPGPLTPEQAEIQSTHKQTDYQKAQERIAKGNQAKTDAFYTSQEGKLYYNFAQPALQGLLDAGRGMIAGTARLGKLNKHIAPEGYNEAVDKFADNIMNYFDTDRAANADRKDALLYAKPTELQGGLFTNGRMNVAKLIPSSVNTLTTMATLLGGGAALGGGKAGLMASSYLTTVESYRKDAKDAGLKGEQLDNFSNSAALLTSMLETISPGNPFTSMVKKKLVTTAAKDIAEGVAVKVAVGRAVKTGAKEVGKEVIQELSQNVGDILVKAANDEISSGAKFNQDLSYETLRDQTLETVVLTTIATTLMMGGKIAHESTPSAHLKSSLQVAATNPEMFEKGIDKMVTAGQINDQQAETFKTNLAKYSDILKAVKEMGLSDDQAGSVAWQAYKGEKMDMVLKQVTENKTLRSSLAEAAKADQEKIKQAILDAGKGIPEVGTELTGTEVSHLAARVPGTPKALLDRVKENDYRLTEIDLEEKYREEPAFKLAVDTYEKSKEDEEGLRIPPIVDQHGKVLDGKKRLVQQYVNGEKKTRVFQQLKDTSPAVIKPEDQAKHETTTIAPKEFTPETKKSGVSIILPQNNITSPNGTANNTTAEGATSEEVRDNAADVIGSRGRNKLETDQSRQLAAAKTESDTDNHSLSVAKQFTTENGLPEYQRHQAVKTDPVVQTPIADNFTQVQDVTKPGYVETAKEQEIFNDYKAKFPNIFQQYDIKDYKDLVIKSYAQLAHESQLQFDKLPVKVEFHSGDKNYENSQEMMDDVHNFKHLWVFDGGEPSPVMSAKNKDGISVNNVFRAVHDFYGHSIGGYQFGPTGEENAWVSHSKMFSPLAQWALTTETRGQNSWVNYSGTNKEALAKIKEGSAIKKQGLKTNDKEAIKAGEALIQEGNNQFQYADQKVAILPHSNVSTDHVDIPQEDRIPDNLKQQNAQAIPTEIQPETQSVPQEAVPDQVESFPPTPEGTGERVSGQAGEAVEGNDNGLQSTDDVPRPISGINEEARQQLIKARKAKTTLTPGQAKINELLQRLNTYMGMREGRLGKETPEGRKLLNDIKVDAAKQKLEVDASRGKIKLKDKEGKAAYVQMRFLDKGNQSLMEDGHVPLTERSKKTQKIFGQLYEHTNPENANLSFPNNVRGVDGKQLSPVQMASTIEDIANGIPSRQAQIYLDAFDDMIKDGDMKTRYEGQEIDVPVEDFVDYVTAKSDLVEGYLAEGQSPVSESIISGWVPIIENELDSPEGDYPEFWDMPSKTSNLANNGSSNTESEADTQKNADSNQPIRQNVTQSQGTSNTSNLSKDGSESNGKPLAKTPLNYNRPLDKSTAQGVADTLRNWANIVEGPRGQANLSILALPKAVIGTALKIAANAIEAGESIAKALAKAVQSIQDYHTQNNLDYDSKETTAEMRALFKTLGINPKSGEVTDKALEKGLLELKSQVKAKLANIAKGFKAGFKAGTSEAEMKAFIQGMVNGIKNAKAGTALANAQEQYENEKARVKHVIETTLEDAKERGVFSSTTKAKMVYEMGKELANANSPLQLLRALDNIDQIIKNVEYTKQLNEANDLKKKIAATIKNKTFNRAATNQEVVKLFLKVNPKQTTDLEEYLSIADMILNNVKGISVKIEAGKGIVRNASYEISNQEITDYTEKQLEHAEELAKQRIASTYDDLVNLGIIDPTTMSLKEMKELIDAINGTGKTIEEIQDLRKAKKKEQQDAMTRMVEYQQMALQDHFTNNMAGSNLEPEEITAIHNIIGLDASRLGMKQLIQMNDAINNIIVNEEFYGSGDVAMLKNLIEDTDKLAALIKSSKINFKEFDASLFDTIIKSTASIHLLTEFIAKSTKMAAEIQRLSGISAIYEAHTRATVLQSKALEEYSEAKKGMGRDIDNAENKYRRGVYARIIQNLGGTVEENEAEFRRVKGLVQHTYIELQKSKVTAEKSEGRLVEQVYNELLEGAANINDVTSRLKKINPNNIKLVDFWVNKFQSRVDKVKTSSEMYNNKIFEQFDSYTATKVKSINGIETTQDMKDMFEANYLTSKLDTSPAKTKLSRMKGSTLQANKVWDLDFDTVQANRYYDTNYDVEAGPAISKLRMFFDSPQAQDLLGSGTNLQLMKNSMKNAVLTQKRKVMPTSEGARKLVKTFSILSAKGARIALGSLLQAPKQYVSVAFSTVVNLGTKAGLYFKALSVPNNIELFNKSSIGLRGDTQAGYNTKADVESIDRSNFKGGAVEVLNSIDKASKYANEKTMAALVKSDVSVARTSWLAYYMQDLQRQKIDLDKINWKNAHLTYNSEAGAYAEQMVSRSQNPNNSTELGSLYRDTRGGALVLKNIVMPFSSFSVNQRVRMSNDVQKIMKGGEWQEAARSLSATLVEQSVFNAIKIYGIGALSTLGARAIARMMGFWDDDDDANAQKYTDIDVMSKEGDKLFTTTDKHKKFVANTISDYFFSGLGNSTQQVIQGGMNSLYGFMVNEEYPNGGNPNDAPTLFFSIDPSKQDEGDYSKWGMYGVPFQNLIALKKTAKEVFTGQHTLVTKGGSESVAETEEVDMSSREHALYVANFLVNSFGLVGVGDAEITNLNRKIERIRDKKMKQWYGGKTTLPLMVKPKVDKPEELQTEEPEEENYETPEK